MLLGLAGAGLGLLAATRVVATAAAAPGSLAGAGRLGVSGASVAPVYSPVMLVAAAASLALAFAGPRLRVVVSFVLGLAGAGAWAVWRGGLAGAADALSRATIPVGAPVTDVRTEPAALLGDAACLVVLVACAAALVWGRGWRGLSDRYDAPDAAGGPGGGSGAGPGAGPGAGRREGSGVGSGPGAAPAGGDAWAALDRGEDPTT